MSDEVEGKPKSYLCFLCLKDGRKLSMKNIGRHFTDVHKAKPIKEVNWCYIDESLIVNSEAPTTKEWEGQNDKQRKVYCTVCNNWKRKDKFENINFKRLPANTCIESTCKSCLKEGRSTKHRVNKRLEKEELKSMKFEGLSPIDQEQFSSVSFGVDPKQMQQKNFELQFQIDQLREEVSLKDNKIKELVEKNLELTQLIKDLTSKVSQKSFESLAVTIQSKKKWPQDFKFSFDEISEEKRKYFIDQKIDESKFECLLKDTTSKKESLVLNDELINEFYILINQDCKMKKKPLIMLNSYILPTLIDRKSNPQKYERVVKKKITPTRYMIFPNHHADIKHWSLFIIDYQIKKVFWIDTYIPSRENAKNGIQKYGWHYDEKTKAILKLLMYKEEEDIEEPFNLVTLKTVDQQNVVDCGVLACYLAYAFSQRLQVQDVTDFQWQPNYSQEYRKALAIAILKGDFESIEAVLEAKRSIE